MFYIRASQMLMCTRITWGPRQDADSDSVALGWSLSFCVSNVLIYGPYFD